MHGALDEDFEDTTAKRTYAMQAVHLHACTCNQHGRRHVRTSLLGPCVHLHI